MQYNLPRDDELVTDLGAVVTETKGAIEGDLDFVGLPQNRTGIADD